MSQGTIRNSLIAIAAALLSFATALAGDCSTQTSVEMIEAKADALEAKADAVQLGLDAIEAKADALEAKADVMQQGLDAIEAKADALEAKLDTVPASLDLNFTLEVENACLNKHRKATLFLPAPAGKLSDVRTLIQERINAVAGFESVGGAQATYDQGLQFENLGKYKTAFTKYCTAYCQAISLPNEAYKCTQW